MGGPTILIWDDREKYKDAILERNKKISISMRGNKNGRFNKGKPRPDLIGNKFSVGRAPNRTSFKKDHIPWNKNKPHLRIRGENHPNWKGGCYDYRGSDWHFIRIEILKRDSHTCQECSLKENLGVHHIIPYRLTKDNSLNNLITLCNKCHSGLGWEKR